MEGRESHPVDAQLEQATASLKASLDEACSADVQRLDTGESVRIEEVLAIASGAAKEVASLRRTRKQGKRPRTSAPTAAPVDTDRKFDDERGARWDAFAVLPTTDASSHARLPEQFQHGWLCFESATEKRRLGPIPEQWQFATDDELRRYRDAAQPVPQRAAPAPEQRKQP